MYAEADDAMQTMQTMRPTQTFVATLARYLSAACNTGPSRPKTPPFQIVPIYSTKGPSPSFSIPFNQHTIHITTHYHLVELIS